MLATKLIAGEDEDRIDKSTLLQTIQEMTQGFIISKERQWSSYGLQNVNLDNWTGEVRVISAILPEQIAQGITSRVGGHYSGPVLSDVDGTVVVEKDGDLRKIYLIKGL